MEKSGTSPHLVNVSRDNNKENTGGGGASDAPPPPSTEKGNFINVHSGFNYLVTNCAPQ